MATFEQIPIVGTYYILLLIKNPELELIDPRTVVNSVYLPDSYTTILYFNDMEDLGDSSIMFLNTDKEFPLKKAYSYYLILGRLRPSDLLEKDIQKLHDRFYNNYTPDQVRCILRLLLYISLDSEGDSYKLEKNIDILNPDYKHLFSSLPIVQSDENFSLEDLISRLSNIEFTEIKPKISELTTSIITILNCLVGDNAVLFNTDGTTCSDVLAITEGLGSLSQVNLVTRSHVTGEISSLRINDGFLHDSDYSELDVDKLCVLKSSISTASYRQLCSWKAISSEKDGKLVIDLARFPLISRDQEQYLPSNFGLTNSSVNHIELEFEIFCLGIAIYYRILRSTKKDLQEFGQYCIELFLILRSEYEGPDTILKCLYHFMEIEYKCGDTKSSSTITVPGYIIQVIDNLRNGNMVEEPPMLKALHKLITSIIKSYSGVGLGELKSLLKKRLSEVRRYYFYNIHIYGGLKNPYDKITYAKNYQITRSSIPNITGTSFIKYKENDDYYSFRNFKSDIIFNIPVSGGTLLLRKTISMKYNSMIKIDCI